MATPTQTPVEALKEFMGTMPNPQTPDSNPPPDPTANPPPPSEPAALPASPPAPAPATPTLPADDEALPRTSKDWKALKATQKAREEALAKDVADARTRIKELEARPAADISVEDSDEYKTLKQQVQVLSDRLMASDIQNHPDFQEKFNGPRQAQLDLAKAIAGEKGEAVAGLLSHPDSTWREQQLDEVMAEMSEPQKSRLWAVANSIDLIESERTAKLRNPGELHKRMIEAERTQRENAARKLKETVEAQIKMAQANFLPFQSRSGDDAWNKGVEERIAVARNLIEGKADVSNFIQTLLSGVAMPIVLQRAQAVMKENETLKAQIRSMTLRRSGIAGFFGGENRARNKNKAPPGSDIATRSHGRLDARNAVVNLDELTPLTWTGC